MDSSSPQRETRWKIASYIWVLNLSLVWRGFEQRKEAIILSVHPLHIREDCKTKKNIGYSELYLDSSVGSGCRQLDTFASICFVSVAMDSFSPPKVQERYQRFFYEPSFYKRDADFFFFYFLRRTQEVSYIKQQRPQKLLQMSRFHRDS